MWKYSVFAVGIGFVLDLILGDPAGLYHPVCLIGKLISGLEKLLRRTFPAEKKEERIAGAILAGLVILISTGIPFGILYFCYRISPYLGLAIESFFCYQIMATKSLKTESMRVYTELKRGGIERSRRAVGRIVGRDTKCLDAEGVTKAAVETVAENASDGVIAPLFYMVIGGAVLGFCYKSINTMDSMIGYKNEKYQYFGTAAAKLDDVVNFIPARISGILMILAAYLCNMDGKHAWEIFRRDRYNHASPNSAQTEAVMAGALGVQLAGDAWYFGVLHKKKYIGDPLREIEPEDIRRANKLMYVTAIVAVVLGVLLRLGISFLLKAF